MSTKNIALDSEVYRRLAAFKRESESFSKAVARMLAAAEVAHSGRDILARIAEVGPLDEDDADRMLRHVDEARRDEAWEPHDLG
jgi:predicted CopG family antitoxin